MSYILDALRKSEQERQTTKPGTVTERIMVNPPQPKQKPIQWIMILAIGNFLVIAYLAWFFAYKNAPETIPNVKIVTNAQQQPVPPASEKKDLQPAVIAQGRNTQMAGPTIVGPPNQETLPSISQLVEAKKAVATQRPNPKTVVEKKSVAGKKEPATRYVQAEQIPHEIPGQMVEEPVNMPINNGTPDLNELPYGIRNGLPNLTINVFSYTDEPKDRFVIVDMVKYKTGQLIKGSVKLKEIRPDSIVVEYGGNTFKVDRP